MEQFQYQGQTRPNLEGNVQGPTSSWSDELGLATHVQFVGDVQLFWLKICWSQVQWKEGNKDEKIWTWIKVGPNITSIK